jgi:type I restriction enzyme, S subunit
MKEPKENFVGTPDNWQITPIKAVAQYLVSNVDKHSHENEVNIRLCNYTDVYKNEKISLDMNFMHATATPEEISKFHLEVDDVVITKDSESWKDIAVPTYIAETSDDLICGYHLAIVRPNKQKLNGRFLFRCLQSRPVALQLELASTGVTRYGLPKGAIGSALIPLPPVDIQGQIANYIDRETTEIDTLIAEKEHMLTLLVEKREISISHAVTRGINFDISFKSSGLDWLGDIPQHWKIQRLKFIAEVQTGVTLGKKYQSEALTACPYLRVANVQDGFLDLTVITEISIPSKDISRYQLRYGDVLMTEGGDFDKLGRGYVWEGQIEKCLHQNHIFAVRPFAKYLDSYFLAILMRSHYGKAYFTSTSRQTTNLATTNQTNLLNFCLPVPPIDEQRLIVEYLDHETGKTDELLGAIKDSITFLKERRSALITAAVTGQIKMEDMVT